MRGQVARATLPTLLDCHFYRAIMLPEHVPVSLYKHKHPFRTTILMNQSKIYRLDNRLIFEGEFRIGDILTPLDELHHAVADEQRKEIIIDFSGCEAAFAGPMLALCAQVMNFRLSGVSSRLIAPQNPDLLRLFNNANWAYFLDPEAAKPSKFRGFTQVPATQFTNAKEQHTAVDKILDAILGAVPTIGRKDLAAIEWSINEITDNVLTHSQSKIGGLVQMSTFVKSMKRVEYIVADAGLGIPATLRPTHPDITSDASALEQAIREGVTRDKNVGQGNGLFGSYRICSHSKGFFQLESGVGTLSFSDRGGLKVATERVPYEGTLVAAQIDFSVPHLLDEALSFGGKAYSPADYIEMKYEQHGTEDLIFKIADEAHSVGSRVAGTPVRKRLLGLIRLCPGRKIILDFDRVPLVSSSFADEVVGKMFVELGASTFLQFFQLSNLNPTVRKLIDRAITQRSAVGLVN